MVLEAERDDLGDGRGGNVDDREGVGLLGVTQAVAPSGETVMYSGSKSCAVVAFVP